MDGEHQSATAGDWVPVYGELLTFDDPESRLPAIDRLEGFHPGGPSLYKRVLVPVFSKNSLSSAWLYVAKDVHAARVIHGGSWPRENIRNSPASW